MSPIILPSEICSGPSTSNAWSEHLKRLVRAYQTPGPSTSNAGIKYVVLAMLRTLATANKTSDTISGSSGFHSKRAACMRHTSTHRARV